MLKTRTWILIFTALALAAAGTLLGLYLGKKPCTQVQILRDGEVLKEIDLSQVKEPYTLEIEDPAGGSNTVLVEPGRIRVLRADCPDQVCVRRGWLRDGGAPIVCLPHRLVIRPVRTEGPDAVAR